MFEWSKSILFSIFQTQIPPRFLSLSLFYSSPCLISMYSMYNMSCLLSKPQQYVWLIFQPLYVCVL